MSDPASQSYTITSRCNPYAFPFSQVFSTYMQPDAQQRAYVRDLFKVILRMYATDTTVTRVCPSR
jgi:hypothetical protein